MIPEVRATAGRPYDNRRKAGTTGDIPEISLILLELIDEIPKRLKPFFDLIQVLDRNEDMIAFGFQNTFL